jgi:hypothetical protein
MGCIGKLSGLLGALVFVSVGLFLVTLVAGIADSQIARFSALTPISAVQLSDLPAEREVMLEGMIARGNPTLLRNVVAYEIEEYRGDDSDGDTSWLPIPGETPQLQIETANGTATVLPYYNIESRHTEWQDSSVLRFDGTSGTRRYSGLVTGGTVTVIGRAVVGAGGMTAVAADIVYAGSRDELIGIRQATGLILRIFGGIFILIGVGIGTATLFRR